MRDLTVAEAALALGVSAQRVRALIKAGRFPGARKVTPKLWAIPLEEVAAYAQSNRWPGRPPGIQRIVNRGF